MTTQSPTAKAGRAANNPLSDAAAPHAYVSNGQLFIMEGGRYTRHSRLSAWFVWYSAFTSPAPEIQERARQIREAMDEAYPQELAA